MSYLSSNQLKQYEDQGYISPIEVLSSSEVLEARTEIELIEKKLPYEIDNLLNLDSLEIVLISQQV